MQGARSNICLVDGTIRAALGRAEWGSFERLTQTRFPSFLQRTLI